MLNTSREVRRRMGRAGTITRDLQCVSVIINCCSLQFKFIISTLCLWCIFDDKKLRIDSLEYPLSQLSQISWNFKKIIFILLNSQVSDIHQFHTRNYGFHSDNMDNSISSISLSSKAISSKRLTDDVIVFCVSSFLSLKLLHTRWHSINYYD